jgi:hypothetical protein
VKQDEIIWQNEVLEMARQAGLPAKHPDWIKAYLAFAKLIAEREREACALICDSYADDPVYCGEAIRTRGEE